MICFLLGGRVMLCGGVCVGLVFFMCGDVLMCGGLGVFKLWSVSVVFL